MDPQPSYSRTLRNFLTSHKLPDPSQPTRTQPTRTQPTRTQPTRTRPMRTRPMRTLPAESKQRSHVDEEMENQEGRFEGEIDKILKVLVSEKQIPLERRTLLSTTRLKKYRIVPEPARKLPTCSADTRVVRLRKSSSKVDHRLNTKDIVASSKHLLSYYPISNLRTEISQLNHFPQIITKDYMRHLRSVPPKAYYPL